MTKPRINPLVAAVEKKTPRWASSQDTAAYAGVSVRTITMLIAEGKIPAYKFGPRLVRVDLNDIDALMKPITNGAG